MTSLRRWRKRDWATLAWTAIMAVTLSWVEHDLAVSEARDCGGSDGCMLAGMPETFAFVAGVLLWGSGCGLIRFSAWLVGDELPRRRRLNAVAREARAPRKRPRLRRVTVAAAGICALVLLTISRCGSATGTKLTFRWADEAIAFSPNDRLMLFRSNRHGQSDLYVIGADGRGLRRVTNDLAREDDAAFAGSRAVTFRVNRRRYLVSLSGANRRRLVTRVPVAPRPPHLRLRSRFSPDRRFILTTRRRQSGRADSYGEHPLDIYLARSDGSNRHLVMTAGPATTFAPVWAPDSHAFAFTAAPNDARLFDQGTDTTQVYVAQTAGGAKTQASHTPGSCCPTWSPRSDAIAYDAPTGGFGSVGIVRADGSGSHTTREMGEAVMTWVLGGRKLAVSSDTGEYLITTTTGETTKLVGGDYTQLDILVSPQGTKAAIVEPGGPKDCPPDQYICLFPPFSRIHLVDLESGHSTTVP